MTSQPVPSWLSGNHVTAHASGTRALGYPHIVPSEWTPKISPLLPKPPHPTAAEPVASRALSATVKAEVAALEPAGRDCRAEQSDVDSRPVPATALATVTRRALRRFSITVPLRLGCSRIPLSHPGHGAVATSSFRLIRPQWTLVVMQDVIVLVDQSKSGKYDVACERTDGRIFRQGRHHPTHRRRAGRLRGRQAQAGHGHPVAALGAMSDLLGQWFAQRRGQRGRPGLRPDAASE